MAENSAIEWTDHTFNPWMGCAKVSPGCDHCYAETLMDKRYGKVQWGPHGERQRTSPSNWRKPLAWQHNAAAFAAEHGRRQRVFCASLADVFDNRAPEGAREDLWALIRATPDLDWLLLTKRPQLIQRLLPAFWDEIRGRVWLGTSTENQDEANRRIFSLLSVRPRPAVFFVSAEPLLGPIDFRNIVPADRYEYDVLSGFDFDQGGVRERVDWVIVGGESGPGARPMHPDWVRQIRDDCARWKTAFLFKQWGEWLDESVATSMHLAPGPDMFDRYGQPKGDRWHPYEASDRNGGALIRVGKKAAGRVLDGTTHDAFPQAAA